MDTVGAFEAKTHFASLLERVAKGETITITKHGHPVAKLVPVTDAADKKRRAEASARIIALGQRHTLGGLSIKAMKEKGRM